jgi:hypothetical protein
VRARTVATNLQLATSALALPENRGQDAGVKTICSTVKGGGLGVSVADA